MESYAHAKVTWFGGRQFVGTDSSKHSMVMSSQDEENGTGMRPVDVLLAAVGGCTAMGVTEILRKKQLDLRDLSVNVSGDMADAEPKYFDKIHIEYVVTGTGITEKAVQDAVDMSLGKYCSVSATVKGKATFTTAITINEV